MTRREAERINHQADTLTVLGFTYDEAEKLRRISMTLHRWYELECGVDNGCVERDDVTGKTYWHSSLTDQRWPTPDRETGARKRLKAIIDRRNERLRAEYPEREIDVRVYLQTDPRGAALYILRPGDVPDGGNDDSYYTRGICVY